MSLPRKTVLDALEEIQEHIEPWIDWIRAAEAKGGKNV